MALLPHPAPELAVAIEAIESPSALADLVASFLDLAPGEWQAVLETLHRGERLRVVSEGLAHRIEVLELARRLGDEGASQAIDDAQREFFLRRQLRLLRKQLGEDDPREAEARELRRRVAEAERHALAEVARLERLPEAATECSVTRTVLDALVALREERIDPGAARRILDEDHHDLDRVMRRVLELRAVRKLRPGGKCPILLFVGPPGVGKTSLGRSIARAVHRDFVWQNLGGVRDEAEIRGHRRTYVGAMLGRIIEGIRRAGSRNGAVAFEDRALREIVAAGRARPASASSSASSARSAAPSPCAPRSTRARERRVTIRPDDLAGVLGPPRHWNEVALRRSTSGVATGLAWTHTGGDIQFVEATRMPGGGKLTLTGQIGEVMRESAQAALSLARSRAQELGIAPDAFKKWDLHVHMPGGSIPKDGPSAGITLFVALVSLLTGRRVRRDVAMTGEITLRGLVLRCAGSRRCWRRPRRSRA